MPHWSVASNNNIKREEAILLLIRRDVMGKIDFVKKVKNVIVDMVVCCNWVFIFSVYNDIESGK